ncbi:MAG: RelA/SpoT family protein [Salibacteraceae bacterium]
MAKKEGAANQSEDKRIAKVYRDLLKSARFSQSENDVRKIRKAFDIANESHKGVRRKSGEAYIFHPLEVAQIIAEEVGLGTTSIVCALLHDVVEDTSLTIPDIENYFGPTEARIIDGLTKIEEVFERENSIQAVNFRKIILTLADDIRVVLIKLADRLHNMRTLDSMRKDKQLKIASETLYIYAPLAHRLGLHALKSELEDLALKYKAPQVYEEITTKLKKTAAVRTRFINQFTLPIRQELDKAGIKYRIQGRPKSVYSIYSKMKAQKVQFEEVYDIFAIRIILNVKEETEKAECWKVYSMATDFYKPNPDRLRDWISTPRANGYESLHTTVMSPGGRWVEVQIRTERMDAVAERGLAAHWKYKDKKADALDSWMSRIREVLESSSANPIEFVDDFKLNLFAKEIFVFTPKGHIRSMPHNSTVLDFAFEIHSEIGRTCIGAKVSQKMVSLGHTLSSGDQVEIITSRAQRPKADWLDLVTTTKAKTAVKNYLKLERKKIIAQGKSTLGKAMKKYGITRGKKNFQTLSTFYGVTQVDDMFYKIGIEDIHLNRLSRLKVEDGIITSKPRLKKVTSLEKILSETKGKKTDLVLGSQTSFDYALATCCHPIPGDDVIGFLTNKGDMEIHRVSCDNTVGLLSNYGYRAVKAKWDSNETISFLSGMKINGFDRKGIVNEITKIISNDLLVNIRSINFTTENGLFEGTITVYVNDTGHLKTVKEKIRAIKGITSVIRLE